MEAVGPVPESLMKSIRLMRQGKSAVAIPGLAEYYRKNPNDLRGIKLYIDAKAKIGQGASVYRAFVARGTAKDPTIADLFAFCAAGVALTGRSSVVDDHALNWAGRLLWSRDQKSILSMIVASDTAMVEFQFQDARFRQDMIVEAWGPVPELSLLRAVVYGRGVSILSATNDPNEKKYAFDLQEPRRRQALAFLTELRQEQPSWALPLFAKGNLHGQERETRLAQECFRKYLSFNPDPKSREARVARQYLAKPTQGSLWLQEEIDEVNFPNGRRK